MKSQIDPEFVERRIYFVRSQKVILDRHLAELYGVSTGQLNRAVMRNLHRFPSDFMFQLSRGEYNSLRCQIGILEKGRHSKYFPRVFTEQGVAMLSGILNSRRAVSVNIAIMRTFVRLRRLLSSNRELAAKLAELEKRLLSHDDQIQGIFQAIRKLMESPVPDPAPPRRIGFQTRGL